MKNSSFQAEKWKRKLLELQDRRDSLFRDYEALLSELPGAVLSDRIEAVQRAHSILETSFSDTFDLIKDSNIP